MKELYILIEQIGSGGAGVVWKAKSGNYFFAIKFLQKTDDKDKVIRFKNECDFCSSTNHERIIKFLGYGKHIDTPFAIMTYYENTLRKVMKNDTLSFEEKIKVCLQLCDALSFIHSLNHFHRDIKPENILLDDKNNVILTDFGISHFKDITKDGDRLANYDYHAPEQMKSSNEKFIGSHTDIYSLGLVINELFTQNIPYGQKYVKVGDIFPVYAEIDNLIENMISQKIEDRINDAKLVYSELELICTSINDTSSNLIEELSFQLENVELPENRINEILVIAANDILMAKRIFYHEVEKLKLFNPNYNMRIGYNVSKFLLNLAIQEEMYKLCKKKFEYECNVYNGGKSSYKPIDLSVTEDKEIYNRLLKILDDYPLNTDFDLSGKILKYYSSCADYHCEELISSIKRRITECEKNLLDAPILWIINHLRLYLINSYEILTDKNYEIEYEIRINWEHTKHFFDAENKMDLNDKYIIKKEEERERIVSEFKKKYNVSIYNQKNDSRLVVFHNYSDYSIFKVESLEKAKAHYIFEGDVLDLLKIKRQSKNAIELEFNSFDLDSTLPRLLGLLEII